MKQCLKKKLKKTSEHRKIFGKKSQNLSFGKIYVELGAFFLYLNFLANPWINYTKPTDLTIIIC